MADAEAKVKAVVEAEDKTGSVFAEIGNKMGTVERSSGSLTSGLKTLGLAGAAIYAGHELLNFLEEGAKLAYDDEKAIIRLNGALAQLGKSVTSSSPEIKDFELKMLRLGQTAGETDQSLATLVRVTGSLDQALYLSKLASDLAASGMGDLQSNTNALVGLYQGRARQAMAAFGLDSSLAKDAVAALNAIVGQVTISTEKMSETTPGKLDVAQAAWKEFTSNVGKGIMTNILGPMAQMMNTLTEPNAWDYFWIGILETDKVEKWGGITKEQQKQLDELYKKVNKVGEAAAAAKTPAQELAEVMASLGKKEADQQAATNAENNAKKIQDAFRELAKNIVTSIDNQIKAIDELKKSMQDLDDQTNASLAKSDEKYKQDVANLAKKAQDRIKEIDKQIAEKKRSMSQGWRDKVDELQKEKDQEQAIIDRAGGIASAQIAELQKDDLTQLQDAHAAEIQDIKDTAEKKKLEMQKEELQREIFLEQEKATVTAPGFYEKATKEGLTFLGAIGGGSVANSFTFNFNGDVNDKDALQKSIIDALNRIAALRQIGAK